MINTLNKIAGWIINKITIIILSIISFIFMIIVVFYFIPLGLSYMWVVFIGAIILCILKFIYGCLANEYKGFKKRRRINKISILKQMDQDIGIFFQAIYQEKIEILAYIASRIIYLILIILLIIVIYLALAVITWPFT